MYTVYMHKVKENGKRYIGQCSGNPELRWGKHGHRYKGQLFYYAIQKYGWDNILHEIIAERLTRDEANKLEIELIKKYRTAEREYGYNIAPGGRNGAGLPGGKNPNSHPIVCIETGQEWECINYCARDIGVSPSSLRESLIHGYRCHKLHFRYKEDNNYVAKNPHMIECVETGQVWKTAQECAAEIGVTPRTVWRYCSGKRNSPPGRTYKYYVA